MRLKQVLKDIDEVAVLYKYLYLDPNNKVTFSNGVTELQIRMSDTCELLCKNLRFPHLPETNFSETITLPYAIGVINILKGEVAEEFPDKFKSRWEEIETITKVQCSLNM